MTSIPPGRQRTVADIVAIVRRSLVAVRGSANGGTGWVVLANGLVMTSHEAVGYEREVTLELESGRRCQGRVAWVDVARDLAMVVPDDPTFLPPLLARPDLPRLGEPVLALSVLPDQPCRVVSGIVSAVECRIGTLRGFEIDAVLDPGGGPIVDLEGRVLGIGGLDLPRGARRRAGSASSAADDRGPAARSIAIPISVLQRVIAAVDIPADPIQALSPSYRCPACNDPFSGEDDRCLACGRLLPHGWERTDAAHAAAEQILRNVVTEIGVPATRARIGPRTFRVSAPSKSGVPVQVTLEIDESGNTIQGKIPVLPVPLTNQAHFYRFLLTLNDAASGSQRFFVEGDTVFLSFTEPTVLIRPGDGAAQIHDLLREGDRVRTALGDPFAVTQLG